MMERYLQPGIIIERKTLKDNGLEPIETWGKHLEIEGIIRPLSGDKRLLADKQTVSATHRLYCESCDVIERDRVVANGAIYSIKLVQDVMGMARLMQIELELVR